MKKKLGFKELQEIIGGFVTLRYLSTGKILVYDQDDAYKNCPVYYSEEFKNHPYIIKSYKNENPYEIDGFQVFGNVIICSIDMLDEASKSYINYYNKNKK